MRKFPERISSLECLEAVFVELLIFPTIFKVFGVLCPALSCSVLAPSVHIAEKTWIPTVLSDSAEGQYGAGGIVHLSCLVCTT